MNIPMRECIHGHGPFPRGSRCRPCDLERRRRSNQASRDRAKAGTHCRRGHPYRQGSWEWVESADGSHRLRACLLCAGVASPSDSLAIESRSPHPRKIGQRRIEMRLRRDEIHMLILETLDRFETMSTVEADAWKIRRAELTREADLLQAQLDTRISLPDHHRKRSRPCRAVAQ